MEQVYAALEATNTYGDALARFLQEKGIRVSLLNPAVTAAFAKSALARNKTDKEDATRIARYIKAFQPALWTPPAPEIVHLQALARRRESLLHMRTMEQNRLDGLSSELVRHSLEATIAFLDEQIAAMEREMKDHIDRTPSLKERQALLLSIPGIGQVTATLLLSELPDLSRFASAPALAAYAGLSPRLKESGSSVQGRSRLSKVGSSRLRKALFFPALTALRYNPLVRSLQERLLARGKSKMAVVGAAMRKLLHLVYGVLKSGKPFDPKHIPKHIQTQA